MRMITAVRTFSASHRKICKNFELSASATKLAFLIKKSVSSDRKTALVLFLSSIYTIYEKYQYLSCPTLVMISSLPKT